MTEPQFTPPPPRRPSLGSADENDTVVIMAANWKVVEQSHPAGDKVAADALIVLTCSKKK
ncbi:hypothetical protein Afil01_06360 [Actinorhabdospora filicis]|uniref:PASTA domain-containing protein n=1 Tax=Actinorhabdospora filicis TaxID=1785913 RepID=A0A9W6W6R8_9ACTN|nr:hypothetical protein [Actinorhabdospora filicis]GLZ75829.1 hypothetical protein Afil01_06360 [Actinorhabdospora filicis]